MPMSPAPPIFMTTSSGDNLVPPEVIYPVCQARGNVTYVDYDAFYANYSQTIGVPGLAVQSGLWR